jgi:hypothetical protein
MPTTTNGTGLTYIVDCGALVRISHTTNNALRAAAFQLLEQGHMKVPTGVMGELKDAYEDEYNALLPHIASKVRVKPAHTIMVASLASRANSGFKIEPYGSADWLAAAVAKCEGCVLVTTRERKPFYVALLNCTILTVDELPLGS